MTPEQMAHAKREKKRYLISFLLLVCACGVLSLSMVYGQPGIVPAARLIYYATGLWVAVATWRLCRAIGIGITWALIATLLAPFVGIFELIILLRVYARRTGIKLSFLMGDRDPEGAAAA
jgi:hypothetical protein